MTKFTLNQSIKIESIWPRSTRHCEHNKPHIALTLNTFQVQGEKTLHTPYATIFINTLPLERSPIVWRLAESCLCLEKYRSDARSKRNACCKRQSVLGFLFVLPFRTDYLLWNMAYVSMDGDRNPFNDSYKA